MEKHIKFFEIMGLEEAQAQRFSVDECVQNVNNPNPLKVCPDLYTLPEEMIVCFWANITERDPFTGCSEWNGEYSDEALPIMHIRGHSFCALILALIDVGRPQPKPDYILYRCTNTRCVDPDHAGWLYNI